MRRGQSITLTLVFALGLAATAHAAWASVSTKQVSVTRRGGDPKGDSFNRSISADGRYVAFSSRAGNMVPDDHTIYWYDVFVRDLVAGTTVRASVDTVGGDPDGYSVDPSITANGRYVAFTSFATDLVGGPHDHGLDVFIARRA